MGVRMRDLVLGQLEELRFEPIEKRIRAQLGDRTVLDSTHTVLVWEPRRILPSYAVREDDLPAKLSPVRGGDVAAEASDVRLGDRAVLGDDVPFQFHTSPGEPLDVELEDRVLPAAAFRAADEALAGYAVLDFEAFDSWYEEDERNLAHARDPYHRVEVLHSSRRVRVEHEGVLLAESASPCLLFESKLPTRYYLPPGDVDTERLVRSDTRTTCAYKGRASYVALDGVGDIAWYYPDPLREAAEVKDHIAFFNERVQLIVDGERNERPQTQWSQASR